MGHKFIIFLLFCHAFQSTSAQERVSAKDVEKQTKFLEARKVMESGKLDKAIDLLHDLYLLDRTDASISFELAKAYASKNNFEEVEKYGSNAVKYSPDNIWFQLFYGDYMLANNRPETALIAYNHVIEQSPNTVMYYDKKVEALLKLNKVNDAVNVYDELEKRIGKYPDLYLSKFDILDNAQKFDLALEQLDKLIINYPEEKKYLKIKAGFQKKIGQEKQSRDTYAAVLKLDPNDIEANVATLMNEKGGENRDAYLRSLLPIVGDQSVDIEVKIKELLPYIKNISLGNQLELIDAIKECANKLVLTHPNEAKAHALYGDVLSAANQVPLAIAEYEKTLVLDNKNYIIWEQLMYLLYDQMEFEKLYSKSNEAIDYFPNESSAFFFGSIAHLSKGKVNDALSLADEGLMIAASSKDKASILEVAKASAFIANKDFEKADESIKKAMILSNEKNMLAFEADGDLKKANNNPSGAKSAWIKSKDMGNNSKRLITKIDGQS